MNYLTFSCAFRLEHTRKKTRDDTGVADMWQFFFNFKMPMPKLWLPRQVSTSCGLITAQPCHRQER